MVVFILAVSFAMVFSGSLLAIQFGLLRTDNPWTLRIFVLGWLLWLFGLFVSIRLHLYVFQKGNHRNRTWRF